MNAQIKLISYLLCYPDESLLGLLPAFRDVLNEIENIAVLKKYDKILSYFEETPLIQLQEKYTETFDLKASNCLNLTYHQWGDTEKRGPALAHLEEIFLKFDFERISSELPDFLPLILEFLYERPNAANSEIIPLYGTVVGKLGDRLAQAGSPYALLFEQLLDILAIDKADLNFSAAAVNQDLRF
jgi:nitrate reductase molybdenum cofactor assembly chaperone NarJ/NarW